MSAPEGVGVLAMVSVLSLSKSQTLAEIGIPRRTYYNWVRREKQSKLGDGNRFYVKFSDGQKAMFDATHFNSFDIGDTIRIRGVKQKEWLYVTPEMKVIIVDSSKKMRGEKREERRENRLINYNETRCPECDEIMEDRLNVWYCPYCYYCYEQ